MNAKEEHETHYHLYMPIRITKKRPRFHSYLNSELHLWVTTNLANPTHCKVCGSLPDADLKLDDGEKFYYYTCWKITKKEKDEKETTLFETDYEKFVRYAMRVLTEKPKK